MYDYADYDDIQEDVVSADTSFSFWKSKEVVEAEESGLSQRLHPSLRSPEADHDTYRYSPSRNGASNSSTNSSSLHNYKPSILSTYDSSSLQDHLQGSYNVAMEGAKSSEGGGKKEEESEDSPMPAEDATFYASLSSDAAAMLW